MNVILFLKTRHCEVIKVENKPCLQNYILNAKIIEQRKQIEDGKRGRD